MTNYRYCVLHLLGLSLAALIVSNTHAEEWLERELKIEGGGSLAMAYPLSWGKKPQREVYDTVTDFTFGPFGPKSKPVFFLRIQTVLGATPLSSKELADVTKVEIDNFRQLAFETEISINPIEAPDAAGLYFSITDPASKRGEFDYLTMAVIAAGRLHVKVYFLSSDGAPDFGGDAMRMLKSLKYLPPMPKT